MEDNQSINRIGKEIWKPVLGWEKLYMVSSYGRIKRLNREIIDRLGYPKSFKEKILTPHKTRDGYLIITLTCQIKKDALLVHRLVAFSFIKKVKGKDKVLHKNNIKTDNHYFNLKWGTQQENMIEAYADGLVNTRFAWESKNTKHNRRLFMQAYRLYEQGNNPFKVARIMGIPTARHWVKRYIKNKDKIDILIEKYKLNVSSTAQ